MLKIEENPELFAYIARQLNSGKSRNERIDYNSIGVISDEELASIKKLVISYSSELKSIKNLNGIEKLINLEDLTIKGVDERNHRGLLAVHGANWEIDPELKKEDYKKINESYNSNQISDVDFRYIEKLSKLRKLNLNNQRKLTEVNFSSIPYLYEISMNNCVELKSVKGLDKLICNIDPLKHPDEDKLKFALNSRDMYYDFSGCDTLKNVDGLKTVIKNHESFGFFNNLLILPTTTFVFMANQDKTLINVVNNNETIGWSEISNGGVRHITNSKGIIKVKKKADEIISECASDSRYPLEKASDVYRWICNNVKYDYSSLNHEKEFGAVDYSNKVKYSSRPGYEHANINKVSDRTRSTQQTLLGKEGVCVGVSNAFRFLLADLGFSSYRCECKSNKTGKIYDPEAVISNHAMTKVIVADENNNDSFYYCDPTWDLGKSISEYFFLNKNEMLAKRHLFTITDKNIKNAKSIQSIIKANKLDVDKNPASEMGV